MKINKDVVFKFFQESPEASHEFREVMRLLGVGKGGRPQLKSLVDELVNEGKLIKIKGNRYGKAVETGLITGKLSAHRDGYGFVTPEGGGEDIFIPARGLRDNLHGDLVEVSSPQGAVSELRRPGSKLHPSAVQRLSASSSVSSETGDTSTTL